LVRGENYSLALEVQEKEAPSPLMEITLGTGVLLPDDCSRYGTTGSDILSANQNRPRYL